MVHNEKDLACGALLVSTESRRRGTEEGMNVTQCDKCSAEQPPLGERAGWARINYYGKSLWTNLDLCSACASDVMAIEKVEAMLVKKNTVS